MTLQGIAVAFGLLLVVFGLAKMLANRVNLAKKEEKAETADQILRLLDSPLLSATSRVALAARQRELALKLHEATETQDRDDNQAGRITASPAAPRLPARSPAVPDNSGLDCP